MSKNRKFYQKKRVMIPLTIGLALIFLGVFGAFHSSLYQTTTSAIVEDYSIKITPKMSAKIIELNVENNANVKKGEILAELDGDKFSQKIKELEEKYFENRSQLAEFDPEITKLNQKSNQNKIEFELARVDLENANDDYVRFKNAHKDGVATKKDLNKAVDNLEIAQEQYEKAREKTINLANELKEIISKKDEKSIESQKFLEELENTKLELSASTIISPKNGKVVNLTAKVGDIANADKTLFEILPDEIYVIAQFKNIPEDKIKVGQKATVKIYSAGFKKLDGIVNEINLNCVGKKEIKIKISNCPTKNKIKSGAKAYVKIKTN